MFAAYAERGDVISMAKGSTEVSDMRCLSDTAPRTGGAATIYSTQRAAGILLALAGMALQWASLHSITFFGTVVRAGGDAGSSVAWVANSVCTFAVFLALFVVSRRISSLLDDRRTVPFAAACLGAGAACFAAGGLLGASSPLIFAGSVFIAFGTTPLIVAWGEMYKYLNPKGEQLLVTLVAIVCSVVTYFVETHLPLALAMVVFVALPFGSLACLARSRTLLADSSSAWGAKEKLPMEKSPALFFVCIAVFSIPYNCLRGSEDMQAVLADAAAWSCVLAVVIVAMVAVALAEYAAERRGVLLVPSAVLFLLSAAMVLHLMGNVSPSFIVPSFLYAGYYLFLAMVYLALGPLVATTDANPVRLFSGAMLANVGGLLLGSLLGGLGAWLGEQAAALVAMGATYVIFFAGCTLLYNRSYSIFRVNSYDEKKYSFEYLAPDSSGLLPACAVDAIAVDEAQPLLDAIKTQCDVARDRFGLSSREHEVLVLLTRGRTIASIAEKLYVSENTVKAHTKAIYRKFQVHTREELLMRVQNLLREES